MNQPALSQSSNVEDASDQARNFPCESCGAKLEFHIGQQQLQCPYCGFTKALTFGEDQQVKEQDLKAALARLTELRKGAGTKVADLEISCKGCAATVNFSGELTTAECPFCGLHLQREDVHQAEHRIAVDAVLPFQVEHQQARKNLRDWVSGLWFAPGEFKKRGVDGKFNGVYLPFWTFDAMTFTRFTGERGDNYTVSVGSGKERRTEVRTRWSNVHGSFDRFFDDVLANGASSVPHKLLSKLEPWPLADATPYNSEVIAGYQAMTYDIELDTGFESAQATINSRLRAEVNRRIGGDQQRIASMDTNFSALTYKHLLMPVWILAYRYHDKSYQLVVNACTGEVQGERPWSAWKIASAVFALLALISLWLLMRNSP